MKQDVGLEAFSVSIAEGFLDQASNPVVETLQSGVGDAMGEVGQKAVG
jgi:hypothetical protein